MVGFLAVGVIALALGIVGEVRCWWDDLPYVTGVVDGLTGVGFGVPVALLLVGRLSNILAGKLERYSALKLAERASADLHGTMLEFLREYSEPGAEECIRRLRRAADDLYTTAVTKTHSLHTPTRDRERRVFRSDRRWREAGEPAAAAAAVYIETVDSSLEDRLSSLARTRARRARADWRFLAEQIRARIVGSDVPWLDAAVAEKIERDTETLAGDDVDHIAELRRLQNVEANPMSWKLRVRQLRKQAKSAKRWTTALEELLTHTRTAQEFWERS
ncbi:hypothetical protein [Streptomyces chryseus]